MKTQWLGDRAENQALKYLKGQGLKHRESNYRSRFGEIDLIMMDQDSLVFVEVRYRQYQSWGGAAASVGRTKQRKLIKTGLAYLQRHDPEAICRFDVVAINGKQQIDWIKNAFDAS